jgi:hypothetical protein
MLRQPLCNTSVMAAVSFDEWLEAMFDHTLRKPEWYWHDDFNERWDGLGLSDSVTVEYLTRLFMTPDCIKAYSLEQVAQAIWFLIGESSPAQAAHALLKPDVPLHKRTNCVDAITNFFRAFVAPTALGPADERKNPFHIACYMWWDIFPTYGDPNVGEAALHAACIKTMTAMLTMPSELCQLSALHGLNHWHLHHPDKVESVVEGFLQGTSGLTRRIANYAAIARRGQAL